MAGVRRHRALLCPSCLLFLLLLCPWQPGAAAPSWFGSLARWRTMLSLSHSLMERVANARAERGDLPGAARARTMAHRLNLLGGGADGGIWSLCWDYLRNYAWRDGFDLGGARSAAEIYRAAEELAATLRELGQMRSAAERARWAARNYAKMVSAADIIVRRLAQGLSRSGALRETVLMFQSELVEGELLRDCLQVGAKDLEGLVRVAKDLFFSYATAPHDSDYEL